MEFTNNLLTKIEHENYDKYSYRILHLSISDLETIHNHFWLLFNNNKNNEKEDYKDRNSIFRMKWDLLDKEREIHNLLSVISGEEDEFLRQNIRNKLESIIK